MDRSKTFRHWIRFKTVVTVSNTSRKTVRRLFFYLRGLTMAGGALGNHVSTRRTTRMVLYMLRKFIKPLATTNPATESPGRTAANP